ncbi:hypothetical protein D4764_03G0006430 [Takifugu flavidus]|uniref:Reverse transcriptase domain-containing protein n=1 Tax=Takifugu flavidus TaxID=433684 RepID=A0A5C6N919_9TELE|nr:hypothetical protein D4764_03G0006430 [Takifugu flavidus]
MECLSFGLGRVWCGHGERRRGKQCTVNTVYSGDGVLPTSTRDVVDRWKEYSKTYLIPPTRLPLRKQDLGTGSRISGAEVAKVVKKLLGGRAPGVDEIRPEFFKAMDVVGLSWFTRLCNITCTSGAVPLDWQTRVVVPLFKKGNRRVCSNYRGVTLLLSLPGKVYSGVLERRDCRIVEPRIYVVFVQGVEQWTSSTPSAGSLRVHGSLPNQFTYVLWRHSTMSHGGSCGGSSDSMGCRAP